MKQNTLLDPIRLPSSVTLNNRVVMAPMTRCRATSDHVPTDIMAEYYQQRSNAGLIITEGVSPSPNGDGYARVPGIYTKEQVNHWKKVTQAVHDKGGRIYVQIMHVGRIAHPFNKPEGSETVAPSAVQAEGTQYTDQAGRQPLAVPRALETHEIPSVIEEYVQATKNAFEAGFDGVELHAANGYLPNQFLASNTNRRTDQYGGSVENRVRFVIETLQAMSSVQGPEKIGIRISPASNFNDIHDQDPHETYSHLLQQLNSLNLSYVHTVRAPEGTFDAFKLTRAYYSGLSMVNSEFDFKSGSEAITSGLADMVSFGSLYISNPDLVSRFKHHSSLAEPNPKTFYTAGPEGYTDYPFIRNL